jgi:NADPH:quinone reductase-like Zn-dependent oxidoreductase
MKAVLVTKYGPPLEVIKLQETDKPALTEERVLVKIHAASLNRADLAPIRGALFARLLGTGVREPKEKRLGTDFAGTVEAVGRSVTRFKPGDEVFGYAAGAFADYVCAKEKFLVPKPVQATFEAASTLPVAAVSALQGLRQGGLRAGQKVLIQGASGSVGMFAVQISEAYGAEVTAVCSGRNVENARTLGADHVIDYTKEDFTKNSLKYDLILAVNGYHSMPAYRRALTPSGACIVVGGDLSQIMQSLVIGPLISKKGGQKIAFMGIAKMNLEDLVKLGDLLSAGKLTPLIDRRYPLSDAAQAIVYLEEGHAPAKVIFTVG